MHPRALIEQLEASPTLPSGMGDRFAGFAVLGLTFRSGHVLALRRFPASSLGPGYTTVWHRDPHHLWTFYSTVPPDQSCSRYFGREISHNVTAPIRIEWNGPAQFNVSIGIGLRWKVRLKESLVTRGLNTLASLLPTEYWRHQPLLGAVGFLARHTLGLGQLQLSGKTPNGQLFTAIPQRLWLIDSSQATLRGMDLGPPGPLAQQARLKDFYIPQRGVFTIARATLHSPRNKPAGHSLAPALR